MWKGLHWITNYLILCAKGGVVFAPQAVVLSLERLLALAFSVTILCALRKPVLAGFTH